MPACEGCPRSVFLTMCWPLAAPHVIVGKTQEGATVADDTASIQLVLNYIEASQRARASGRVEDFEALRPFLAPDIVIKIASPWTDEPWQVMHRGADSIITRLQAPINKATSLTTENTTVQQAGNDVYVEQLSTIVDGDGSHVSMVCHIFTVVDGIITGLRGYRNDRGIPAG